MKAKHRKILEAIFVRLTRAGIVFSDIEALFVALGAKVIEGDGSRIAVELNDDRAHFHRPHPGKEAKKYQVENAREFLEKQELKP